MHIVFGNISKWQVPFLLAINYLKFKVFYLNLEAKTVVKRNEIANKLKLHNIYPLPLELEKKIPPEIDYTKQDPKEFTYKYTNKLIPQRTIKNFCKLFSTNDEINIRLLILDFLAVQQENSGSPLNTWSELYSTKKIIYLSFKFKCFYIPPGNSNILKIIIPLDIINYFLKNIKNFFLRLKINKKNKTNRESYGLENIKNFEKKDIALVSHKGIIFGQEDHIIFEKSLYYSDDKNSKLNKENILHLDYNNYIRPSENLNWLCLRKCKVENKIIYSKIFKGAIKTFFFIRSWHEFIGWLLCIICYKNYLKFFYSIKQLKDLKVALIDYDVLCPKTLILALKANNIRTIATQERFIHSFYTPDANVILDTYFVTSDFAAKVIEKSKFYNVKNIITAGMYRSEYLKFYRGKYIPKEIIKAKNNNKKIITVLGYQSPNNWFESYKSLGNNWSSQINFLNDILQISKNLKNCFIVLRYKNLDWIENTYFKNILKEINESENITISNNYKEANYAYKLCGNSDLIIAKHTSIADECLVNEIPVLFYEYSHNQTKIVSTIFDFLSSKLMCYNFDQLIEKSKSILFDKSSEFKEEIKRINNTVYKFNIKNDIKNKIINDCLNIIEK